ncbi:unnamed protein product [Calypogeia fissa]
MVCTTKFFQELQRTLSIANFVPRKAVQDIVYDGFVIPKGWAVLPLIKIAHFDPVNYEYPMSFNPDRFDMSCTQTIHVPAIRKSETTSVSRELVKLIYIRRLSTTYTTTGMTYHERSTRPKELVGDFTGLENGPRHGALLASGMNGLKGFMSLPHEYGYF